MQWQQWFYVGDWLDCLSLSFYCLACYLHIENMKKKDEIERRRFEIDLKKACVIDAEFISKLMKTDRCKEMYKIMWGEK